MWMTGRQSDFNTSCRGDLLEADLEHKAYGNSVQPMLSLSPSCVLGLMGLFGGNLQENGIGNGKKNMPRCSLQPDKMMLKW